MSRVWTLVIWSQQGKSAFVVYECLIALSLSLSSDGGFYCDGCPKSYAPASSKKQISPGGPTFDGSYGVDTEDIISIPTIDFGSLYALHITSCIHQTDLPPTASCSQIKCITSLAAKAALRLLLSVLVQDGFSPILILLRRMHDIYS
jgi:hypothetical protein